MNRTLFVLLYLVLFLFLTVPVAADEPKTAVTDAVEDTLNLEMILAGIQHYDTLGQSGSGNATLTWEQASDGEKVAWPYELSFDRHRTRMEFEESFSTKRIRYPRRTLIATPTALWEIVYHETRSPSCTFQTNTGLMPFDEWADPRRWLTVSVADEDLPTYLRKGNFSIKKQETFNNVLCYVLEAKPPPENTENQSFERFWIAPEQGFRFLKYEHHEPLKADTLHGDFKKGSLFISRTTILYKKYGEAWFPKSGVQRNLHIDSEGKEHFYSGMTLALKNFNVNIAIPPGTFTIDLPEDAMVEVQGLQKTKKEFLSYYKKELLSRYTSKVDGQADDYSAALLKFLRNTYDARAGNPSTSQQLEKLHIEIPQKLQERLDLLHLIEDFDILSNDEDVRLIRQQTREKTEELMRTIFDLATYHLLYSKGDISAFRPGGEFYDLMEQNQMSMQEGDR